LVSYGKGVPLGRPFCLEHHDSNPPYLGGGDKPFLQHCSDIPESVGRAAGPSSCRSCLMMRRIEPLPRLTLDAAHGLWGDMETAFIDEGHGVELDLSAVSYLSAAALQVMIVGRR